MYINVVSILVLCIVLSTNTTADDKKLQKKDIFIPTNEWQVVEKGQKIPKGLHVRINFETGITEAKLLDENEKRDEKLSAVSVPKHIDALEDIGNVKSAKKFKTYQEIKEDLDYLKISPKTDNEVILELFQDYQVVTEEKDILTILEDIEYLAHQYDNALEFVRLDGFKKIIYKSLNSTSDVIKRSGLVLLGALSQNNPKVQIHAIETGSLSILLRIIADKNGERSKAIYALGSIIRRFPWAQIKLVEHGGVNTLINVFQSQHLQLILRSATLLNDLITEQKEAETSKENEEKLAQYTKSDIKNRLLALDYCNYLNDLFLKLVAVDRKDVYSIEKCLTAMKGIVEECRKSYTGRLVELLSSIEKEHAALGDEEDIHVADSIRYINKFVKVKNEL